jgi:acetoacetyl-CoA synthetase
VHLASISGGTDIVSCFVLGNPALPVWRGEIQGPGLGMAVDVWDDNGNSRHRGEKGELVCTKPFPAMPIGFWNDPTTRNTTPPISPASTMSGPMAISPNGRPSRHHHSRPLRCHAQSRRRAHRHRRDLQPGRTDGRGVEAICIGQDWDDDVRVVLFVRLAEGVTLDDDLKARIRAKIRTGASPRHVPAKIIAVSDIPRTKSGKIVELAVRDVVHGRAVKNQEALANPEALDLFAGLEELKG